MQQILVAGVALATFIACSSSGVGRSTEVELVPALRADQVGSAGVNAIDTVAGIRVEVRPDAWQWSPNLSGKSTPMFVDIQNSGKVPVALRYNRLRLTGASGQRYSAMPVFVLSGSPADSVIVRTPAYPVSGFTVAPHLRMYYVGAAHYDGPFTHDSVYYTRYLPALNRFALPAAEMVRRALPEGVLEPGGRVGGIVFFEPFSHEVMPSITFTLELVNPDNNQSIGTAVIPFVARLRG